MPPSAELQRNNILWGVALEQSLKAFSEAWGLKGWIFWGVGFGTIFKCFLRGRRPQRLIVLGGRLWDHFQELFKRVGAFKGWIFWGAGFGIIFRRFLKGVGLKGGIFGPFSRSFSTGWGPKRLNILGVAWDHFQELLRCLGPQRLNIF